MRPFGPKKADHPSVGTECPACKVPFKEGDFTTLVTLGPGDDPEAQRRAREGMAYNSIALELHWTCATGETVEYARKLVANELQRPGLQYS